MRELLEPHAAAQAAGNIPPAEIEHLEAMAAAARPHAHDDWTTRAQEFDFALHLTIAKYARNYALGEAIRKCWTFKRLSYLAVPEAPESLEMGYGEHLALLTALKAGDAVTSRAAVTFHLRSAANLRPAKTIV
ncbi:MAG TPA: FCD domain-containing protein [Pirellulales bacterium]|nr:FCD domain-containing protein [Pirellulales bacterium]